jgi:microcystin-dependent protein
VVFAGDGITVAGAGSERNPYVITNDLVDIETGVDVQVNNTNVASDVHGLDFRGTGVTVAPGTDEVVITIPGLPEDSPVIPVPPGTIWMFGSGTPPTGGWLLCDGATVTIATYPNLFSAIGTNFGGDGTTNFQLPNLLDRFPIGASATKPVNGAGGGAETAALALANLPPHTHTINHDHAQVNTTSAGTHDHRLSLADNDGTAGNVRRGAGGATWGAGPVEGAGAHVHAVNLPNFSGTSGSVGTGTPVDIMPPWLAIAFIIKT